MCRTPVDPTANPYRLPRNARPNRYDLTLSPDLDRRDFVGEATITLDVAEPTAELVCNAVDLTITKAWVVSADGTRNEAVVTFDLEMERAIFTCSRTIPAGASKLHVQFSGQLNDKLVGFYASTYVAEDGSTKVIATTQMEATDARRAFPCWDEPDAKAVFGITLVVTDGLMAVSNMHEVSSTVLATTSGQAKRSVRFGDTPIMSTYLVCLVVGELEATAPIDVRGIPLRVIARPGRGDQAAFALDIGRFALTYFEDWYGIKYPGTKMDLIATPDFAFGAMENLGAVTFREALLLVDESKASKAELERIADVVAHEIAHMWFGDLVTMLWWNGLWLNEAFATFAEVSCVAKYKPEWDRWTSFGLYRSMAQQVDALHTTRPIEFPVISPTDAEGMFDVLTYEKGASVLRMLEQYLGEEHFRLGVKHYLETHSFANAETTDLWDAIEEVTGEPVRTLMDGWILQGGFPLINASIAVEPSELVLEQSPFTYLPSDKEPRRWDVPVLYRTLGGASAGTTGSILLGAEPSTVVLPAGTTGVVVNAGGHGFYRVRYNEAATAAITSAFASLAAVERYDIVADAWAAVLANAAPISSFVQLVRVLTNERDPNVWSAALAGLRRLDATADESTRSALQLLVRSLLGPIVEELGTMRANDESPLISALRGSLTEALGNLGSDPAVADLASEQLERILADDGSIDADLAPALLTVAAAHGDEARYDRIGMARSTATSPQNELRLLHALGAFGDPALIARTLDACLTDAVRTQDAPYVLLRMLGSRAAGVQTWNFIRDRWTEVIARFPDNVLPRMLDSISTLTAAPTSAEVEDFFTTGPGATFAEGKKSMAQAIERLQVNRTLAARVGTELPEALTPGD